MASFFSNLSSFSLISVTCSAKANSQPNSFKSLIPIKSSLVFLSLSSETFYFKKLLQHFFLSIRKFFLILFLVPILVSVILIIVLKHNIELGPIYK